MSFLVVLAVFLIVQHWGSGGPVHRDEWWSKWLSLSSKWGGTTEFTLGVQLLIPIVLLWLVLNWISGVSTLLLFLVSIPLLLYCLGRGNYSDSVKGYCEAYHRDDNEMAAEYADRLGVDTQALNGWKDLHQKMLSRSAYLGFERIFVSFFWFFILGVPGAALYRLATFARDSSENSDEARLLAARLQWLLEWPVVRVFGLSLALTGNFLGGFEGVKNSLFSVESTTEEELEVLVHSALNVNASELRLESVSEQEVEALLPLLSRTLMLWLAALAIFSLI